VLILCVGVDIFEVVYVGVIVLFCVGVENFYLVVCGWKIYVVVVVWCFGEVYDVC